ncbi:hypothetical protein TPHA_0N00270 [Tetrapisispora phaffii CBS 4417]|uniref:Symplekin/Pta1 N-terminal domain-containing protein n=1 Tax=Tetrapisispora phaffii (strain ATCC 24235 / CBS 4417 / NBRC 1672 / NRRL Y-8282 / UCD 70-5) TaxID=1071381 RepID=G8C0Y0_TETPH|nr:hypothetical protein TPHA_0N00270 [Tetrapisispora phaffii CBS 4417]CCE65808.1 hypothetical protein TPHA_0N00270 [Tetrapisispora phaffii CBS 4417]
MAVLPEIEQLAKARELAMENSPQDMLPKVLETSLALYRNASTSQELKLELAVFYSKLYTDILNHEQISNIEKPFIASKNFDYLWDICKAMDDELVFKNCTFAFAKCYPMLFDIVAKTSNQKLWDSMQEMKQFIISKWSPPYNSASLSMMFVDTILLDLPKNIGSKLAIAKFMAEVIIVQTSATPSSSSGSSNKSNTDVQTDVSISSVPNSHPVISNKAQLDAEAKKLLNLLLNYLVEEPIMVPTMFMGVIDCLSFIIKSRPQSAIRISSALLRFNIDAKFQIKETSSLNYRLSKRFVERSYKNFVQFCLKAQLIKNSGQMSTIYTKLSKISQTLHVIGEETKSKGILNYDKTQYKKPITDKEKKKYLQLLQKKQAQRQAAPSPSSSNSNSSSNSSAIDAGTSSSNSNSNSSSALTHTVSPPVPEESTSTVDRTTQQLMDLQNYTLSKNSIPNFFNSSPIAFDNSYGAIYSLMNSKNSNQDISKLSQDTMIKLCSEAFYNTSASKLISALSIVASRYTDLMTKNPQTGKKRKFDVEGEVFENESNKRIKNEDEEDEDEEEDEYNIDEENLEVSNSDQNEIGYMKPLELSEDDKMKHLKRIVSRIMNIKDSENGADSTTFINKDIDPLQKVKLLQWDNKESWLHILTRLAIRGVSHDNQMSNLIRETIYNYFLEDINERISVAIEWLNEEWFYETFSSEQEPDVKEEDGEDESNYRKWSLKLLDGLVPFIENKHRRLFIRLISELPSFSQEHIDMIRPICLDPARSSLGFQSLKFLIMFRPPVKPFIKNFLEQIKNDDNSMAEQCDAILSKYYQETPV